MHRASAAGFRASFNGWDCLFLSGSPFQCGYQHGYLLAERIADCIGRVALWAEHDLKRSWGFFRQTAQELYLPRMPDEYKDEINGIVAGATARNVKVDFTDILALNGYWDTVSYHYWLKLKEGSSQPMVPAHGCSAFVATGSYTRTSEIIMAHNEWWIYLIDGAANILVHLRPEAGHELIMQVRPGFISSGIDWLINSKGLIISSTAITGMTTFKPDGVPYFVRLRKATQYSDNIKDWVDSMLQGNNGGLANQYLLGDCKNGQIGMLELGTFHHRFETTKDGFFVGSNLAYDDEVKKETIFDYRDPRTSPTARHSRWEQLMTDHKGEIDIEMAKAFMRDHVDASEGGKEKPSRCTLCGHLEDDPRGWPEWELGPYYPGGTLDGKITSGSLAAGMATWVKWGRPCGTDFIAEDFSKKHPEYGWQMPRLRDLKSYPWTLYLGSDFIQGT